MKKLLAGILIICFSLLWAFNAIAWFKHGNAQPNPNLRQENIFGITGSAWQNFIGDYTPGLGSPAVSTDDYYHQNGLSGFRPYDLLDPSFTGVCASAGASIAASRGRYMWPIAPDHGQGGDSVWNGSFDFRIGYSNDPGVLPSRATSIGISPISPVNAAPAISTITASISNGSGGAGNILNVTAYTGLITNAGQADLTGAGVTTATITSQSSGTQGQIGNYIISGAPQLVTSQTMTVSQRNYFIYYDVSFVCNPDDAATPFWLYAEGQASSVQHEMGVIKSSDLITWTTPTPTHNGLNFNTWSSFQRVNRIGTGNWISKGAEVNYPQNGNSFARGTWTSPDGLVWAPGNSASNLNACIPASAQVGTSTDCTGSAKFFAPSQSPFTVTIGGTPWVIGKIETVSGTTRVGSQWVGRVAVDANQSVIDTPVAVNISSPYVGNYPGISFLQVVTGYVEDGIAHYYAMKGWPISNGLWAVTTLSTYSNGGKCKSVPAVNGVEGYFGFTAKIDNGVSGSGNILTVTAISSNSIIVGSQIFGGVSGGSGLNAIITGQLTGSPGQIGTYTLGGNFNVASTSFFGVACGGLWQQNLDYYTEIVDATAAAGAAPVGVNATCASSTATVNWITGILPTDTTRLYRGTTAGSQTTLVGDFSGGVATDTGMTLNAVTYYKLVYLNGGVEQKNRVVSTYCSTSSAFVNDHMTRAAAGGADMSTCNRTTMDNFYAWLTSNGKKNNLLFATMADFCIAKSGSVVTKVFDMGTTRLPRGGDYTPQTSGVTYNATGINGKPAWVNGFQAGGYYGGGLVNNIRRKTQITVFAAYQKPGTAQFVPIVFGEGTNSKMMLAHTAGTPGAVNFYLTDATQNKTATATITGFATDVHTIAGTYSSTNGAIAYADAVAGTPQTGLVIPSPNINPPDILTGQIGIANNVFALGSGNDFGRYTTSTGVYFFNGNYAQASVRAQMIFDVELTGAEITSLDALVR